MIVQCQSCETKFRLPEERLKPGGVKVRCSRCRAVFRVTPSAAEPPTSDVAVAPPGFGTPPPPTGAFSPPGAPPVRFSAEDTTGLSGTGSLPPFDLASTIGPPAGPPDAGNGLFDLPGSSAGHPSPALPSLSAEHPDPLFGGAPPPGTPSQPLRSTVGHSPTVRLTLSDSEAFGAPPSVGPAAGGPVGATPLSGTGATPLSGTGAIPLPPVGPPPLSGTGTLPPSPVGAPPLSGVGAVPLPGGSGGTPLPDLELPVASRPPPVPGPPAPDPFANPGFVPPGGNDRSGFGQNASKAGTKGTATGYTGSYEAYDDPFAALDDAFDEVSEAGLSRSMEPGAAAPSGADGGLRVHRLSDRTEAPSEEIFSTSPPPPSNLAPEPPKLASPVAPARAETPAVGKIGLVKARSDHYGQVRRVDARTPRVDMRRRVDLAPRLSVAGPQQTVLVAVLTLVLAAFAMVWLAGGRMEMPDSQTFMTLTGLPPSTAGALETVAVEEVQAVRYGIAKNQKVIVVRGRARNETTDPQENLRAHVALLVDGEVIEERSSALGFDLPDHQIRNLAKPEGANALVLAEAPPAAALLGPEKSLDFTVVFSDIPDHRTPVFRVEVRRDPVPPAAESEE